MLTKERAENLPWVILSSFVEAGIPNADIIRSLTIHPAKLLGMETQRGRFAKGMFADLVATKVNPLDDVMALKQVSFVMKEGNIVVNKTQ